jgi:epoxyqueuosine reductase
VSYCIKCGLCKTKCINNAIVEKGVIKEKCLSEITQKKVDLSSSEEALVKKSGCIWGCDICQTVCPMNRDTEITPVPFFREEVMYVLGAKEVEEMPEEHFKQRAFSFRGRKTILRNLKLYEENK